MNAEITSDTAGQGEIFSLEALFPMMDASDHKQDPLYAYKVAASDPDTMYHHEAMNKPDRDQFLKAMAKEVEDQWQNGNFSLVKRCDVPKGKPILPTVWQMKQKRDIMTGLVKKYKARLNIDGSRMKHRVHYDQTYVPVASWSSVCLLLALAAVHGWKTTQIDYVHSMDLHYFHFAHLACGKTYTQRLIANARLN